MTMTVSTWRRWGAIALAVMLAGCESAAVVAPSGTTLTVATTAAAVSFSGSATITAQLRNPNGVPPDGTMVTFTATLGSMQPSEAPTAGGVATAVFIAGAASGTAVITASSGNAAGPGVTVAVGVAAVSRVIVAATPASVPFGGGATTVTATAVDAAGNPLNTIPISFATTAGTLTSTVVKTDVKGVAQVTLSTTQQAVVTATAAPSTADAGSGVPTTSGTTNVTVLPRPQPVVSIAAVGTPVAQTPTSFTIGATPAVGSNTTIQSVSVNFGDGARAELGAASGPALIAQHVYKTGGTYTATVTVVDSGGGTASVSTIVEVGFAAPVSVTISAGAMVPIGTTKTTLVTLTAALAPPTAVGAQYLWSFDDGKGSQVTTSNSVQNVFEANKTYRVTVTVTLVGGTTTVSGFAIIFVP